MADQLPTVSFPRPSDFFTRLRLGVEAFRSGTVVAQPAPENPLREASPEDEGAAPAQGTYSRAYGGFSIDPRWLSQLALNDDTILQREGAHDLKLYDVILDDDVAASAFQQRRLAVISRPWEVDPGGDSPLDKAAADHLREQIKRLGWDRICDKMLYGRWYGYAVGEAIYELGEDGKIWLQDILVPDRKWFGFTNAGELRLKTVETPDGEEVPPNKFWAYRTGASHDFAPYGVGLAHWCYWPVWFKKNGIKFWAVYLEKFGMPTALGTFPEGSQDDVIQNTLEAAKAVARDSAVVKPDNVELALLAEGRQSSDSYLQFVGEMNDALLRVILSQTGTSKSEAQGLGGSQSEVHKDVRDEVVRADSDALHESFNRTVAAWLTRWNFGPEAKVPNVYRNLDDQEDLTAIADRDAKLYAIGIRRTEESVKEVYGEGYELRDLEAEKAAREEEAAKRLAAQGVPAQGGAPGIASNDNNALQEEREKRRAEFANQDRLPLYVRRDLTPASARKLLTWAREQKIPNLEAAGELHVTVLYSKTAVDWFDMGEDWGTAEDGTLTVRAGGPRKLEKLGEKGAIALRFASPRLRYRHEEMVERGASHDYDDYLPHVTVAFAPELELEGLTPYLDELVFGPEIFEAIDTDGVAAFANAVFASEDLDVIDQWAAALVTEADPIFAEFVATLQDRVQGIKDANGLRLALVEAAERFPAERLGELTGLPMVAVRAGAEAGIERQVRP